MNVESIFVLQFSLSLLAWAVIAAAVVAPWLRRLPRHEALFWLSLPHVFRHVGMVFLVPGVVAQPLPGGFAVPAAYGDLAAGLLALLALVALRARWSAAIGIVWAFNLVGSIDLLNALRHIEVVPQFGATWYIPTMLVPLLLVSHFMLFRALLASTRDSDSTRSVAPVRSS